MSRYIITIKDSFDIDDAEKIINNTENLSVDSKLPELKQIIVAVNGSKANIARLFNSGFIKSISEEKEIVSVNPDKNNIVW